MNRVSLLHLTIGVCISACWALPVSADFKQESEISVMLVSDDNPYKLADPGGSETAYNLNLDYDFTKRIAKRFKVYGGVEIERLAYGSAYDDADEEGYEIELGLSHSKTLSKQHKLKTEGGIYFQSKDDTYISRSSGEVATKSGQEIPDRFSHDSTGFILEFDYYVMKSWRLSLDFDYMERDYNKDYEALGLSKLDYEQYTLVPSIRYRPNEHWQFSLALPFSKREYDDRRGEDLNGDDIPGSDLEYETDGYRVKIDFEPSNLWSLSLSYKSIQREDNYSGRKDYDKETISGSVVITPNEKNRLEVSYRSIDRDSDNVFSSFNDQELRSASGDKFSISYERVLRIANIEDLVLVLDYENASNDHTSPLLENDQKLFSVGFIKQF